jgi:hypothetical protein
VISLFFFLSFFLALCNILNQLGPDSLASLRKLAESYQNMQKQQGDKKDDEQKQLSNQSLNFIDHRRKFLKTRFSSHLGVFIPLLFRLFLTGGVERCVYIVSGLLMHLVTERNSTSDQKQLSNQSLNFIDHRRKFLKTRFSSHLGVFIP